MPKFAIFQFSKCPILGRFRAFGQQRAKVILSPSRLPIPSHRHAACQGKPYPIFIAYPRQNCKAFLFGICKLNVGELQREQAEL